MVGIIDEPPGSGIIMLLTTMFGHISMMEREHHFDTNLWPIFLINGSSCVVISTFVNNHNRLPRALQVSHFYGRFMNFLSKKSRIGGWFAKNPNRIYYSDNIIRIIKKVEVI